MIRIIKFLLTGKKKLNHAFNSYFISSLRGFLLVTACLTLASCQSGTVKQKTNGTSSESWRKINPKPKQAYEIRMQIRNIADMPATDKSGAHFAVIEGTVQFDVSNAATCGKSKRLAGNVPVISSHEPFHLTPISATEYVGTIYTDMILDEDYYGRGVCHWELTEVRVALQARPIEGDTRFVSYLPAKKIFNDHTQILYFWKGYYPSIGQSSHTSFGRIDLNTVKTDQRDEFFSTTLSAKDVSP